MVQTCFKYVSFAFQMLQILQAIMNIITINMLQSFIANYKVSNATNASVCLNNCKYATNASNRSNWFKMFQTCVECASNATNPLNK